jgi:hypothetical protein
VPSVRHLNTHLKKLDPCLLAKLFPQSVRALQQEIPGLGEVIAYDVKHIYANVKENNFRAYVLERLEKDQQPANDPYCRMPRQKKYQSSATRWLHQRKKGTLLGLWLWRGSHLHSHLRGCRAG